LNSSPDIPLLFLFIQLVVAVVLLHLSATISSRIEIPALDHKVAIKLIPVVSVNIIGLVFNILCLRDVEASFFQVGSAHVSFPPALLTQTASRLLVGSSFH
jgi:GDP-fucose transporter C1